MFSSTLPRCYASQGRGVRYGTAPRGTNSQRSKVRRRRYLKGVCWTLVKTLVYYPVTSHCNFAHPASRGPQCYHPASTYLSIPSPVTKPLSYSATLSLYGAKTNQPSGRPLFLWFKDRGKVGQCRTARASETPARPGRRRVDGRDHAPRRIEKAGRSKTSTSRPSWQEP